MHQKLKAIISLLILGLSFALLTGCQIQAAVIPGFSVSKYDINVELQTDGSADITETIFYQVQRKMTSFSFVIGHENAGSLQLKGIETASAADPAASPVFVQAQPAESAGSQNRTLTYEQKVDNTNLTIKLLAVSEANATRIIKITYRLAQAIGRHADASLLDRQFFTTGGEAMISQLNLSVKMPSAVTSAQSWNLPLSLADFQQVQSASDRLDFQARSMAAGQSLRLICLLPLDLFPKAKPAAIPLTWDEITARARQTAVELTRQANARTVVYRVVSLLFVLAILIGLVIYWLFDRELAARFRQRLSQEIPPDCPPAVMALLMHQDKPGRLILATLLDLVRRGELGLHGCVFSLPDRKHPDYNGFAAYEIYLLEWFFGRITKERTLSTAEIRRYARDRITAPAFHAYYQEFRHLLDEEVDNRALIDTVRGRKGKMISILVALLYAILSIAGILYLHDLFSLWLLLPAAGMAVYGHKIRRLTANGRELYVRGQALHRTMRNCAAIDPPPASDFFNLALPLSVVLGVDGKILASLLENFAKRPTSANPLEEYGVSQEAGGLAGQVQVLIADLKVMESMLSASLLMARGIHW